jgi:hypothetical protein
MVTVTVLRQPLKTVVVFKKVLSDSVAPNSTEQEHISHNSTFNATEKLMPQTEMIPKEMVVRDLSEDILILLKAMNLMILFYPMAACAYSKAIFDCRSFSVPAGRMSGAGGSRISPNHSSRDISRNENELPQVGGEFGMVEVEMPVTNV